MFGEELLGALNSLNGHIAGYTVRGLKGAVGTQMDQISLFDGDLEKVSSLEQKICKHLGIPEVYINVGQVYPRSQDFRTVRRVMLPDAFYACDGMFETFLTILDQMDAYPAVIEAENNHYLPFLMTTTIMMEAVKAGVGREAAHKAIKENAVATVNDLRTGVTRENDLLTRLASDDRIPLSLEQLTTLMEEGKENAGTARIQVDAFVAHINTLCEEYPEAAAYSPGSIL